MTLTRFHSAAFQSLDAALVEVEVDVAPKENPSLIIVGLPDTAVRESKDRVLTAIKNAGYGEPQIGCTVNLAPGDLKKEGPLYDLPIALGLIAHLDKAMRLATPFPYIIVGELGLSGELRPIRGSLSIAILAKTMGFGVILPKENAAQAAAVPGVQIIPVVSLKEAVQFLKNPNSIAPYVATKEERETTKPAIDFADIKGQAHAKRAIVIAAAGGHNALLSGPPGSGKTMMAKALTGILPPLAEEEALEVTKIYSLAGLIGKGKHLVFERPFRSPHHTISNAGLIGGGSTPRPGEVSLAHRGVLFLDELPEFSRSALEVLRQPLEDGQVTISRAQSRFTFPTRFICIGAMNPCPCGYYGHPERPCKDSPLQVERYQSKISGPLLDRMDLHVQVAALQYADYAAKKGIDPSAYFQAQVVLARRRMATRFNSSRVNAEMSVAEVKEHCPLDAPSQNLIKQAMDEFGLSARAINRLLKVALTIADIENEPFHEHHLLEAIQFRSFK